MDNKQLEYFVIFGGGGVRGISYVGAYSALRELNIKFSGYAGSSIGSIFATLCALNYSFEDIKEFFYGINIEFFKDINLGFVNQIALSKGEVFLEWMRDKIESKFYKDEYKKGEMPPVKFCDIDEELIIYSVDITNNEYHEYSNAKTPDAEIALAVRASVSMPGLFTPLEVENNLIVDGDLMKSWPLWRLSDTLSNKKQRILEFRLEDSNATRKINSPLDYINAVYNTISAFATDFIIDLYGEKDKFDYITINTDNISVIDFMISDKKKEQLEKSGYSSTHKYFKEVLPQKRQRLYKNYSQLQNYIVKLKDELEHKKLKGAYLTSCEMFVYLCEHKKYIDMTLYEKILYFKKVFDSNVVKSKGFFNNDDLKIKEFNLVIKELNEIHKIITLKTLEIKD